ncbi:MAG: hypothetical protein ABJO02_10840 [Reichenbachiella sp.]|uniref:hypothetical protein n=1 Tax=Reichenbachiella sp. TaxID=2184521 RepID=UPI0032979E1B
MSKSQFFPIKMNQWIIHSLSLLILWTLSQNANAQSYSLKISPVSFTIDEQSFNGYTTIFTQPFKEVKKEWWKYVNARTIIFNKKTHLVLTVPAKGKETNEPLQFISQLTEQKDKKKSILRVALVKDGIPNDQLTELDKQVRYLLKDFKVDYFTTLVQEKIDIQELTVKKISREMDEYLLDNSKLQLRIEKKPEEKNELAQKLKANTGEIEKLQAKLISSQKKLAQYKHELTLIK